MTPRSAALALALLLPSAASAQRAPVRVPGAASTGVLPWTQPGLPGSGVVLGLDMPAEFRLGNHRLPPLSEVPGAVHAVQGTPGEAAPAVRAQSAGTPDTPVELPPAPPAGTVGPEAEPSAARDLARVDRLMWRPPTVSVDDAFEWGATLFDKRRPTTGAAPVRADAATVHAKWQARHSYRPPVEWWTVEGRRYGSTAELRASGAADRGPVPAVHHHRPAGSSFGVAKLLGTGAAGAVVGAGIAAVLAMILGGVGSLISAFVFFDPRGGIDLTGLLILSAGGAGIGAMIALSEYLHYMREGITTRGTLRFKGAPGRGRLLFDLGPGRGFVSLARHERAAVLVRGKAERRLSDIVMGFGAAPMFAAGSLVPFVLIVWPFFAGAFAGLAVFAGTHVGVALGGFLGIVLAYGAASALWTGINVLGWTTTLSWVAAASLAGGLVALAFGPRLRGGIEYADKKDKDRPWWDSEGAASSAPERESD